ncbi:LON peptidase substrate-binding domain-containing protein [Echinicola marina]|uniref:LON peptidase substrate-binding domain-containing protein n=1 Tax=Echinicola marina TaxID=2859768 RepID=UPI001CF69C61|nr:LON peptidase substrate-binding domain-containing protein [Echinicola marina]UCS95197.1 LON peptidase substrate-binding domain-containing protein [Echinicola marina]
MSVVLPLFPLKLVAFPRENLNLHIFEPRYKQLIKDCLQGDLEFGICVYTDRLMTHGTVVKLVEVYKEYDDGRMDVKTIGLRPFRLKSFENPLLGRMYAGGEVELLDNDQLVSEALFNEFVFYLQEVLRLLHAGDEVNISNLDSFTYAHKVGLKLEEEYQLLLIEKEDDRMDYIIKYLKRILPVMREIEKAKEKIKMNGHFKSLDPLDF